MQVSRDERASEVMAREQYGLGLPLKGALAVRLSSCVTSGNLFNFSLPQSINFRPLHKLRLLFPSQFCLPNAYCQSGFGLNSTSSRSFYIKSAGQDLLSLLLLNLKLDYT